MRISTKFESYRELIPCAVEISRTLQTIIFAYVSVASDWPLRLRILINSVILILSSSFVFNVYGKFVIVK